MSVIGKTCNKDLGISLESLLLIDRLKKLTQLKKEKQRYNDISKQYKRKH